VDDKWSSSCSGVTHPLASMIAGVRPTDRLSGERRNRAQKEKTARRVSVSIHSSDLFFRYNSRAFNSGSHQPHSLANTSWQLTTQHTHTHRARPTHAVHATHLRCTDVSRDIWAGGCQDSNCRCFLVLRWKFWEVMRTHLSMLSCAEVQF
jgi:hypothetical protein